jgi:hypothetical protein
MSLSIKKMYSILKEILKLPQNRREASNIKIGTTSLTGKAIDKDTTDKDTVTAQKRP